MRSDSISRIKHKEYFGSPLFNNFITTDFDDAQILPDSIREKSLV